MTVCRAAKQVCFLTFVLALIGAQGAAAQERLTLGSTMLRNGSTSLPFVIAEENGFYKAQGLNVGVVVMQNQVVVNGVVARNRYYRRENLRLSLGAAYLGFPFFMSADGCSDHYLITAAKISNASRIFCAPASHQNFGASCTAEAVTILKKYGLNPEKDVTFLQIGGSSSRFTAIESGSIQLRLESSNSAIWLAKHGFNQLVSFNEVMNIPMAAGSTHPTDQRTAGRDRENDQSDPQGGRLHLSTAKPTFFC